MRKTITLKQHIEMFLMKYKNYDTLVNYKKVFRLFQDVNTTDIKKIIQHAQKAFEVVPWRATTKNNRAQIVKTFCRRLALATFQNNAIYYIQDWKTYPEEASMRQSFNDEEQKIIAQALIDFNHPKFTLVFKLLAHNGLRLGEFVKIDWKLLKENGYEIQFLAQKGGKTGYFAVPVYLIDDFELYGADLSYNTIQNLFTKFNKFVHELHPNFRKPIHAHIMRHFDATKAIENGLSPEEIKMSYGLADSSVLNKTYVHANMHIQKQIYQRKNMEPILSLEIKQKDDLINNQRQMIFKLKEKLKAHNIECDDIDVVKKLFTI